MFFIRRIKSGGKVKIGGKWWVITPPEGVEYDGRLDGIAYACYLYDAIGHPTDRKYLPFGGLWGTAMHFYDWRDLSDCDHEHCDWAGPECFSHPDVNNGGRSFIYDTLWEEGWDHDRWMQHQRDYIAEHPDGKY